MLLVPLVDIKNILDKIIFGFVQNISLEIF